MKNSYLDRVGELIDNKRARVQILTELEAHIADKTDYYLELGYSREEAESKAAEEMGDPEEAAVSLNALQSVKWYKKPFNIIVIALILLVLVLSAPLRDSLNYGSFLHDINHSLIKDVLSLALFVGLALVIALSYKRKNKFTAVASAVFCLLLLLLPLLWRLMYSAGLVDELASRSFPIDILYGFSAMSAVFAPMYFSLVTLFTKNPFGLVDSVLTPTAFPYSIRTIYTALSYLTILFFLVWSLIVVIKIIRSERCLKSKSFNKSHRVFRTAAICVSSAAAVVMLISSVFACLKIPEYNAKSRDMIDFITEYEPSDTKADVLKRADSYGFNLERVSDAGDDNGFLQVYSYYFGNCSVSYFADCFDDEEDFEFSTGNIMSYSVDFSGSIQPISESSITVGKNAFDSLKPNETTLGDFKHDGDFYKARSVTAFTDGRVQFFYSVENLDSLWVIEFENGVLIKNESMNFENETYENETEPPVDELPTVNNPLFD